MTAPPIAEGLHRKLEHISVNFFLSPGVIYRLYRHVAIRMHLMQLGFRLKTGWVVTTRVQPHVNDALFAEDSKNRFSPFRNELWRSGLFSREEHLLLVNNSPNYEPQQNIKILNCGPVRVIILVTRTTNTFQRHDLGTRRKPKKRGSSGVK
jgi:hypothetical protein